MSTHAKPDQAGKKAGAREWKSDSTDQVDWRWADPKTLKVNSTFKRLIPLQSKGELSALEESIKAEGCRDPLLVWKGHNTVLDGHTRRELCIRHKKQVKVREVELADEKAAVEFIVRVQRQRRNLSREAISYFRGAAYNAVKQPRGGDRRSQSAKGRTDPLVSTAERMGKRHGVSEKTIFRDARFAQMIDKLVADHGDPEVGRKLLSPDVRLTFGLARLLLKQPAEERKANIDRLIEGGKLPRDKKGKGAAAPRAREVAQSIAARLQAKGGAHARAVFKQMARLLGFEVTEKAPDR